MEIKVSTCKRCEVEFDWIKLKSRGKARTACDTCVPILYKEAQQRYAASAKGKAASRRATAKWVSSERGAAYMAEFEARDETREKRAAHMRDKREADPELYRERYREWFRNNYAKPEGRAKWLATVARRRGCPTANYKRIALAIANGEATCYVCGGPGKEVDHVLPISMARFLGILDCADDYVAAICFRCHVCKTKEDIRDVRRMRKLLS